MPSGVTSDHAHHYEKASCLSKRRRSFARTAKQAQRIAWLCNVSCDMAYWMYRSNSPKSCLTSHRSWHGWPWAVD